MDRATSSRESSPFSDIVRCDDDIISLRFRSVPNSGLDLANADSDSPCTSLLEVGRKNKRLVSFWLSYTCNVHRYIYNYYSYYYDV